MATLTDPKQATNQPIRKPKIPIPLDENGAPIYPTRRAKPPPKTSNLTKPTAANGALVFPTRTYQPPATASFVVHHHGGEGAGTRVFAPRVGTFTLRRAKAPKWSWRNSTGAALDVGVDVDDDGDGVVKTEDVIRLDTPGMICGTSQGTVKHLTRDHVALGAASGCGNGSTTWIHVPFEKFLEFSPAVPLLHPSALPLHTYLTHPASHHILSLSLRNPGSNHTMPPNTNAYVKAQTVRGVRKVSNEDWIGWTTGAEKGLRPDLVWSLADVPKTLPLDEQLELGGADPTGADGNGRVTSQKRVGKSLERTLGWLEQLLAATATTATSISRDNDENSPAPPSQSRSERPPIIVQLMGGSKLRAREEFSTALMEKLDDRDALRLFGPASAQPAIAKSAKKRLDDGVTGYTIELVDLPTNAFLEPPPPPHTNLQTLEEVLEEHRDDIDESSATRITSLLRASLRPLTRSKPRVAHTAPSPHAILRLILECGIDLFDVDCWATEAADLGVSLSFEFPAEKTRDGNEAEKRKKAIGEILFDERYASEHVPLGVGLSTHNAEGGCGSCYPAFEEGKKRISHSQVDDLQWPRSETTSPADISGYTKAYIHHLLHTHEMSAHTLLHLHNLAVVSSFFVAIREMLQFQIATQNQRENDIFETEVRRFYDVYDADVGGLLKRARGLWKDVEEKRGKGRLKREKDAKAKAVDLGAVDL